MVFTQTKISNLIICEPNILEDARGFFFESYNKETFEKGGILSDFVQDNQSFSSYGTIRGIHLQLGEFAQAKLVRVLAGEVLDVAVDLRKESPTYGEHFSIKLSEGNKKQLYIPRGFGHGFSVLSETATLAYKCDNLYNKDAESGIIYNDKDLNIDWIVEPKQKLISDKDLKLGTLRDFSNWK